MHPVEFVIPGGGRKAYLITLEFVQLTSPIATVAELREGGKQIDIIDLKNLSAGYVVYA